MKTDSVEQGQDLELSERIFSEHRAAIFKRTDRLFCALMAVQWLACILTAIFISPRTWIGSEASVHIHVWAALLLGGSVSLFPIYLTWFRAGEAGTRHVVAVAQMLMSALLIHLTGGRIETHFHVFGSLAILAFYRDWRVMISATLVVALDHAIRGIYFPQSVFGVLTASPWRWVEHAGWVVFEDIFLITSCFRSVREMKDIAIRRAQLENMNEEIEAEVLRQTEELQKARDAALSASKSKSEFLATMSHEIRTPMNAILGMGELLAEGKLDEEQREYVETLRRNGDHLMNIINDILDLSKVEVGKLSLEQIPFDLPDAVEKVVDLMAVRAHQKGLELVARVDTNVPRIIEGDGNRLRQVLMNLIGNAIKFTEKGEVVVDVSLPFSEFSPPSGMVEILFKVRDTGIGIPENKRGLLFGAFNQMDSSTTRKYGGTGLGLSICRKLVELMGGQIDVKSKEGQGSEFYFTVSFKKAEGMMSEPLSAPAQNLSLKSIRILIVDDNEVNRMILREMLKETEAFLSEASSAAEGLSLLRGGILASEPFDIILLDCRMPDMDGFGFIEEVKKDPELKSVSIMMLTSDDRRSHVERAKSLGLSVYLVKPIKKRELFDSIRSAIKTAKPKPKAAELEAKAVIERKKESGLHVLLVEDNQDNRLLIQSYLKKTSFRLDAALNGLEAFEKMKHRGYDIVLMDLHMPVMDGYESARKMREWEKQEKREPSLILALSASALPEEVSKSMKAGCDQHLSKPIKKEVLLKILNDYEAAKKSGDVKAGRRAA